MTTLRPPVPRLDGPRGVYLRNTWYVAGWADALADTAQSRIFLEEPVALFRDEAGVAHAIGGRCPHRFAPLGDGPVIGCVLAARGAACSIRTPAGRCPMSR